MRVFFALVIIFLLPAFTYAAVQPWADYPEGEGQQITYALCSGCHSFKLVAQQGMSRERWDETLHWMTEKQGMGVLHEDTHNQILNYLAQAFPENQSQPGNAIVGATLDSLPEYNGRSETFAICSACHSMRLVAQQGLNRDSWEETLEWMTEEEGMAELPADMHNLILDYLVWAFPQERPNYSR